MTDHDSRPGLFSGFVPLTALARLASVAVVLILLSGFWLRQGLGWPAGLMAGAVAAGFGLGALYNPIRVGLSGAVDPYRDPRLQRGASWAGGATGLMLAAGLATLLSLAMGAGAMGQDLLWTISLAVNAAYLPAKAACLAHGCCRARPDAPGWLRAMPGDLRGFELTGTMAVLAVMLALPAARPWATLAGLAGHFGIRLFALGERGFPVGPSRLVADPGIELAMLAALMALAVTVG